MINRIKIYFVKRWFHLLPADDLDMLIMRGKFAKFYGQIADYMLKTHKENYAPKPQADGGSE